ncbi:P-loop containing nucleoside triphosphate hydrolase protein [Paraphysoderma sedebokerense]|nr:P-loop containing nucleoside triphosphate hydrolase protein [Paraphysoderma sedebokerense]
MAQTNPRRKSRKTYSITLGSSWFGSAWLYAWLFRLIYICRNVKDMKYVRMRLPNDLTARVNGKSVEDAWKAEMQENPGSPTVLGALKRVYKTHYLLIGLWKLVWGIFTWLGAYYFLKVFILFLQNNEADSVGHAWAIALLVSSLLSSIAIHQLYGECAKEGVRIKSALTVLIFRKALVLARVRGGAGEVINLVSTDVSRVQDAVTNFHFLWSAFVETVAILVIAFVEIGIPAFTSLGIILLLAPVQIYLGRLSSKLLTENTQVTTERVHLMSELLTAIKLIKFYAWEKPFSTRTHEIREHEMRLVYRSLIIKSFNFAFVFAAPVVVAIVALAVYQYTSPVRLTSAVAFTILSVFNTLRYPLLMLPMAVKSCAGAVISLQRLNRYMTQNENVPLPYLEPKPEEPASIDLKNASFTWEGETDPTLHDISVSVNKGEILAVIGDVGSGKSSFIAALLGQMKKASGDLKVYGTTSYVPQEAWLLNFTLRENILFGSELEEARYKEVIRVCALQRDLTLLVAGDQTEIAERGANLSGGQKQRTSLARAVYHNGDIILLDDPLSAVDQAVGRHIFEECIKGHLKGKTIVMVTHQLQYLPQVDKVMQLKNGKIVKFGTHAELMANDAEYAELINNHVASGEEGDDDVEAVPEPILNEKNFSIEVSQAEVEENIEKNQATIDKVIELKNLNLTERNQLTVKSMKNLEINERTISSIVERNQLSVIRGGDGSHDLSSVIQRNQLTIHSFKDLPDVNEYESEDEDPEAEQKKAGQLIGEDKSTQSLGWPDYVKYARAGSGVTATVFIMIFFFVVHGVRIGSDYWLRLWIPDTLGINNNALYVGVYGAFIAVFSLGVLLRGVVFSIETDKKAKMLHNNMFRSVMRAPMAFFDTTPLGRILSAFSKHQYHVDETMPDAAMQGLQYAPLTLGAFLLVAIIVPWNWAPIIASMLAAAWVVWFSSAAENKLKALEAVTKPPVFAHLTSTLEGLFSIRAYNAQKRFDDLNIEKLDVNHEALIGMSLTKSWTALYLDIITSFVIYFTALFMVLFRQDLGNSDVDRAATGGLALSNALQILVFLQWTIRMLGEVQAQISSVGQLDYYATQIKEEAPAEIPDKQPPASWPDKGEIKFNDIVLKYHEFGVAVLKNVTFDIEPTEKVGIVGRTGSGKSTIVNALLRIVESCGGKIVIDGVDIAQIGLDDLRTKIAIIPQEPVLFVGTVRSNLDPFHKSTDDQIWRALESVHLADKIRTMPSKLDSAVIENGKNFSLGQRQLFCIARAILSNTKVLVLDEATAAIDMQTDALIQNAIKENFADKTTITIAHRLNTIIESDKVLVMDGGVVVEFDEPLKLLDIPNGHFAKLVENTGEATAAKLRRIAEDASAARAAAKAAGVSAVAKAAATGSNKDALGPEPAELKRD